MAMGLSVVASDLPPLTEMVRDGETGLLFRPGDPRSLADACIRIGRSRETRKKLGHRARTWVERERDWKKIVALYGDVYAGLRS
jgi:glycosyltransferase involved in cell wall biosynthesis